MPHPLFGLSMPSGAALRSRKRPPGFGQRGRFFLFPARLASRDKRKSEMNRHQPSKELQMTISHTLAGNGPEHVLVMLDWNGDHTNYDGLVPWLDRSAFSYAF